MHAGMRGREQRSGIQKARDIEIVQGGHTKQPDASLRGDKKKSNSDLAQLFRNVIHFCLVFRRFVSLSARSRSKTERRTYARHWALYGVG
jgi:hypothetical protein